MDDGKGDNPLLGVQLPSRDMHGRRDRQGLQGLLADDELLYG
jgi:hypothetical protein